MIVVVAGQRRRNLSAKVSVYIRGDAPKFPDIASEGASESILIFSTLFRSILV